jgi:malate dehydrogenase (oxaloacetate-decarboxylating)(NADP+)
VVFSGSGAAAIACAHHLLRLGLPKANLWMTDAKGLVYTGRAEEMFPERAVFAQGRQPALLADVIAGADVLIGLSVANIVTPEMLKKMNPNPIIFAMANPNPEISYDAARAARPDAIVATGRSDYPNQINNVLGFPFIFRGALDVRARAVNEEMKLAASLAIAQLAKQPVTPEVLQAYQLESLEFGPNYLVPKPLDKRVCAYVAPAVAEAAMKSGLARLNLDIDSYRLRLEERFG